MRAIIQLLYFLYTAIILLLYTAIILLLYTAIILLLYCYYTSYIQLLYCYYIQLLYCYYTVIIPLLYCYYTSIILLLYCYYTPNFGLLSIKSSKFAVPGILNEGSLSLLLKSLFLLPLLFLLLYSRFFGRRCSLRLYLKEQRVHN